MTNVMVVHPTFAAKTVPEFIAYRESKSRQGQHGICGQWEPESPYRGAIPDDGGREDGTRPCRTAMPRSSRHGSDVRHVGFTSRSGHAGLA
jgi:hypothetical protein